MSDSPGDLPSRIKRLMMAHAQRTGEPTSPAQFGRALAEYEGRSTPYTAEEVHGWLSPLNNKAPALSTLRAMVSFLKLDERQMGYWAYGEEHTIYSLTDADYDVVHRRTTR